ncbi:hypothetical protein B0E49_03885 [Polaromonas sp. C04]|nr:hypothetical protein B0E49_03885 [Polaromonas sp. C04]
MVTLDAKPCRLTERFNVRGYAYAPDRTLLGVLISRKVGGVLRRQLVKMAALREPRKLAPVLEGLGLKTPLEPAGLKAIAKYIAAVAELSSVIVIGVEGLHWLGAGEERRPIAVLGDTVYGNGAEPVVPVLCGPSGYAAKGTLQAWQQPFKRLAPGNPLLIFALCFGLAPPLATLTGLPMPGVLLCGLSSTDKITLTHVIHSLFGPPRDPHQLPHTNISLEMLAARARDLPLVLDELGARGGADVLKAISRLGGGITKAGATASGELREWQELRAAIFATGEVSVAQQARATGDTARAGHEAFLPTIRVGEHLGVYTDLHGAADEAAFTADVSEAITNNFGVAYPAFVEQLIAKFAGAQEVVQRHWSSYETKVAGDIPLASMTELERRVLAQFTVVALTGRLAVRLEILPLEADAPLAAVRHVFGQWLAGWRARKEELHVAPLATMRAFFKLQEPAVFVPFEDWEQHLGGSVYVKTHQPHGLLYLLRREYFENELCREHGIEATVKALQHAGLLVSDKRARTLLCRMPGRKDGEADARTPFYAIKEAIRFD